MKTCRVVLCASLATIGALFATSANALTINFYTDLFGGPPCAAQSNAGPTLNLLANYPGCLGGVAVSSTAQGTAQVSATSDARFTQVSIANAIFTPNQPGTLYLRFEQRFSPLTAPSGLLTFDLLFDGTFGLVNDPTAVPNDALALTGFLNLGSPGSAILGAIVAFTGNNPDCTKPPAQRPAECTHLVRELPLGEAQRLTVLSDYLLSGLLRVDFGENGAALGLHYAAATAATAAVVRTVPEIDAVTGSSALTLLAGSLALVADRRRRSGKRSGT